LLNTGVATHGGNQQLFRFELGWLTREGFADLVRDIWAKENKGSFPMKRWQHKIRKLRQYLRGWAKNVTGSNKKEKQELCKNIDDLDKKAESIGLQQSEIDLKHVLK